MKSTDHQSCLVVMCLPVVLLALCAVSLAQSADASFGTVYGSATAYACFSGVNSGYYYPANGSPGISTNAGWVAIGSNQIQPGTNCIPATLYPNSTGGSITGSTTVDYVSEDGQPDIYVTYTSDGTDVVASAVAGLKYQVLSVLYIAPGNASSSGFGTTVSAGATTSVSQNFSNTDSLSFGAALFGGTNSVTFSSGQSSGDTSAFTTSYQATSSSQLNSVTQAMDHTQDQVYLLVDPSFTVTQTGSASGSYAIGASLDATGSFGSSGTPGDVINMNIAGFKNPVTAPMPLEYLEPQVPQPGTTLPGLSIICANPLPPSQCTTQNACGCTSTDFAPIVVQDELTNDTVDSTPPSSIDSSRYVYVGYELLEGPPQSGGAPVKFTYSVSDGYMSSETLSNGTSYSVGYSHGFNVNGPFSLQITATNAFTYTQTQTVGTTNGTAHTSTVTLGSSDVGCQEYVDIYEDTTYHTFAYALSQPAPSNCQ